MREWLESLSFLQLYGAAAAWVASWMLASLAYRVGTGRPLLARRPEGTIWEETWSSGGAVRFMPWAAAFNNCLRISVTPTRLEICPHFPWTLSNRLDRRIERREIRSVTLERRCLTDWVVIEFGREGEPSDRLHLVPRDSRRLIDELQPSER